MKLERADLRKMILREMIEGEVINMSDYQDAPAESPAADEPDMVSFESVLSDVHEKMMDYMNENFDTLNPDQQQFLDDLLDQIEEVLGIGEESIEFDGEEEEDL